MRIKEISLNNYRAFWGLHTIPVNGNNVLIYGENGSGKTSLFRGLERFFESVRERGLGPEVNIFCDTPSETFISLTMDDAAQTAHELSGNGVFPGEEDFLLENSKQRPFFSYKNLLRVHLAEKEGDEVNLLGPLVRDIIHNSINPITGNYIGEEWDELLALESLNTKTAKGKELLDRLENIRAGIEVSVDQLAERVNEMLTSQFGYQLEISLKWVSRIEFNPASKKVQGVVYLRAKHFGKDVPDELSGFLNEARLSAIAIGLYLSSLKLTPKPSDLPILVLDDIFIGLDMSNRIPLLNLLKSEFADYQIFITTYDRAWFDLAKNLVGNNWLTVEMYTGEKDDPVIGKFEYPIVIAPSDGYYEKALKYANKKPGGTGQDIDYAAAGNYLRKEAERVLKGLLYGKHLYRQKGEEMVAREQMQELWDSFMVAVKGWNHPLFSLYNGVVKSVLNPLSHDNLNKPVFRYELDEAFRFVEGLRTISARKIVSRGDALSFLLQKPNDGRLYFAECEEDVCVWEVSSEFAWSNLEQAEFSCRMYEYGRGDVKEFPVIVGTLSKLYDKAAYTMDKTKGASSGVSLTAEFRDKNVHPIFFALYNLQPGDLVKVAGTSEEFLVTYRELRKFPNSDTRYYLGYSNAPVKRVPEGPKELIEKDLPDIRSKKLRLIEREEKSDGGRIMLEYEGQKLHIPDPETFLDITGVPVNKARIITLSAEDYDAIPEGRALKKVSEK
jgi:energy-coupling factor transporter ATP-binding protein EcfA2